MFKKKTAVVESQDNFIKVYCWLLLITSAIFFLRYLNFSVTKGEDLDQDFAVYYRAAENLVLLQISPYFDAQKAVYYPYLYPPFFNLVLYPLGILSFNAALFCWLFFQAIIFIAALNFFFKDERDVNKFILYSLALPFILNVFICGQTGLLTASIMLFGFPLLKKKQVLAGAVLALIMFKPQLGIILPIVFITQRNFKALASFIVTVIFMIGASLLVYGQQSWLEFFAILHKHSLVMESSPVKLFKQMTSVYIGFKILGFSNLTSIIIHSVGATIAVIAIWWNFRRNDNVVILAFFALSYLISPYVFVYDTALLCPVLYYFARHAEVSPLNRIALILGGFFPIVTAQIQAFGVPSASIVMIFICVIIYSQSWLERRQLIS